MNRNLGKVNGVMFVGGQELFTTDTVRHWSTTNLIVRMILCKFMNIIIIKSAL